jgi:hypothetical protein
MEKICVLTPLLWTNEQVTSWTVQFRNWLHYMDDKIVTFMNIFFYNILTICSRLSVSEVLINRLI